MLSYERPRKWKLQKELKSPIEVVPLYALSVRLIGEKIRGIAHILNIKMRVHYDFMNTCHISPNGISGL